MSRNRRRQGHHPGRPTGGSSSRPAAITTIAHVAAPGAPATAPPADPPQPHSLRKDQDRALTAYAWAESARNQNELNEYEIAVQSFAAALLRSGFAAAVSLLERNIERPGFKRLLDQLADRDLPGIAAGASGDWPAKVRSLADVALYMRATRELALLLGWLRRACRALGAE